MTESSVVSRATNRSRASSRLKFLIPVPLFLALAVVLGWGLTRDPRTIPTALIGVAIDWGVYGVPETYVVSAEGRITYRHIGPVTEKVLNQTNMPMIEALRHGETSGLGSGHSQTVGVDGERAR